MSKIFTPYNWNAFGDDLAGTEMGIADILRPSLWDGCIQAIVGPTPYHLMDYTGRDNTHYFNGSAYDQPWSWQTLRGATFPVVRLSGGTNDYIKSTVFEHPFAEITISAWARTSSTVLPLSEIVDGFLSTTFSSHRISASGATLYWLQSTGTGWQTLVSTPYIMPGAVWHHIAATNDGVNAKLFVDGIQKATTSTIATSVASPIVSWQWGASLFGSTYRHNGYMSDLRVYNRGLHEGEIRELAKHPNISYECRTRPKVFVMGGAPAFAGKSQILSGGVV